MKGQLYDDYDRMSRSASRLTGQNVRGLLPIYDFDLRATHARTLLPAALASVSFGRDGSTHIYGEPVYTVDVRTVGFVVSFRSCRAILGGFLLLAMLCSYLVSDTGSLPSLSRSTGCGHFPVSPDQQVVVTSQSLQINKNQYPIFNVAFPYFTIQIRKVNYA